MRTGLSSLPLLIEIVLLLVIIGSLSRLPHRAGRG